MIFQLNMFNCKIFVVLMIDTVII